MATIAKFVAEMGLDPSGVGAGLAKANRMIGEFVKSADRHFNGLKLGVNQARNDLGQFSKSAQNISFDGAIGGATALWQKIVLLAGAIGLTAAVWAGISFNATMETAQLGIASLITAQAQLRTANGRTLVGTEALAGAQSLAADQMQKLRIAGIQTAATTEELVQGFQQAVGVGLRWGLTLDQIRNVTIGITQAAGALGVPMNQLNEEIRDLLGGNISARNTRVATALGITNQDIKNARETGHLADYVLSRLKAFNIAGAATAQTWTAVLSNIKEAFQVFTGTALKPAFEEVKVGLNTALADAFDLDNATISKKFSAIVEVAQRVFTAIGHVVAGAIAGAITAAKEFNDWLVANRDTVNGILEAFGVIAGEVGSLVGDMVKLLASLVGASAETGILKGVLYTISLLVALIHTGFEGLVYVFAKLGQMILNVLLKPLVWLATLIGKIVGIVDKDMAAAFEGVAAWGNEFLDGIAKGVDQYETQLAAGNALDRWVEKVQTASVEVKKLGKTVKDVGPLTLTPNTSGVSHDDQIKDLEQLAGRLITLRNSAEKAGTLTSQFSGRAADAMLLAEKLMAGETDKLSDNTVRLTIVLDKLKEAYLKFADQLPALRTTPVGQPRAFDARGNPTTLAARTSLLRGGTASTVGLAGLNGGPGFTLPVPKAAPTPPATQSGFEIRFNAIMQRVGDAAEGAARGLGNIVRSGGLAILQNILSQLNPFALIVKSLSDAMEPLAPVLAQIAAIVAETLRPVFEALAPVVQAFIPFFRALLQVVAPLLRALTPLFAALVPILEALFPVIKFVAIVFTYVVEAAATVASMLLRFGGNVIIVIGQIFYALAKAIDSLPGIGAKGAMRAAEGLIDVGKGMLKAADEAKKTAEEMAKARDEIRGVNIDHTVDGIQELGDAASKTAAQLLNVPTWFKIAGYRFAAAVPRTTGDGRGGGGERRKRFPDLAAGGGATDAGGMSGGGGGGVTITGDVLIDARTLSAGEMFDAILREGKQRARAQGVGSWSQVS